MALTVADQPLTDEVTRARTGLTARRVLVVKSDDGSEVTSAAAIGATGIPSIGAAHPDLPQLSVDSITANRADGPTLRLVDIAYTTLDYATPDNPLEWDDVITWSFQETTESYFLDKSDPPKPAVNSAGQRFAELPIREATNIIATIRRNVASFDFDQALQYRDAINSDTFTVDGVLITERQAKLQITGVSEVKNLNGTSYREITIQLKFRDDWRDNIADRGTEQLNDSTRIPIFAGDAAVPVVDDWPLDGSGVAKPNSTDVPATLEFKAYPELAFAPLNFT
ncbi:MAG: hypothetical protein AAGI46_09900 [Planctomycetota bacterium]